MSIVTNRFNHDFVFKIQNSDFDNININTTTGNK